MRRWLFSAAVILTACTAREREFGVDVFSADTIPARVYMNLSGSLQLGLRADNFFTSGDSLVLLTPVSLIVQRGEGSAEVFSLDSNQVLAMQPMGVSPDSADKVGVTGRRLKLSRVGEARSVTLEVVKP